MFVLKVFSFFLSCARRPTTYPNEMHNQAERGREREKAKEREEGEIYFFSLPFLLFKNNDELSLLESRDVFNDVV